MIRIAILEDDPEDLHLLQGAISRYGEEKGVEFEIQWFQGGMQLLDCGTAKFDLLFLDIEVQNLNGMETAKRIRKTDAEVAIIFTTRLAHYAIKGYDVDALDFLVKPVRYRSLCFRLDKALRAIQGKKGSLVTIVSNRSMIRLNTDDIYYIEANRHKLVYHTALGNYETSDTTITAAAKSYAPLHFSPCHNSFLCNLKYVTGVTKDEAMVAGERLKISRGQRKGFLEALTAYWGKGNL